MGAPPITNDPGRRAGPGICLARHNGQAPAIITVWGYDRAFIMLASDRRYPDCTQPNTRYDRHGHPPEPHQQPGRNRRRPVTREPTSLMLRSLLHHEGPRLLRVVPELTIPAAIATAAGKFGDDAALAETGPVSTRLTEPEITQPRHNGHTRMWVECPPPQT